MPMDDAWTNVMRFLTPREARHLRLVVRGLRADMCRPPAMSGLYLYAETAGCDPPCVAMRKDVEMVLHNYPRGMLVSKVFRCIMELRCMGLSSLVGIKIDFSGADVVYTCDFRVDELELFQG